MSTAKSGGVRPLARSLATAATLCWLAAAATAQETGATISGTVTDPCFPAPP